MSAIASLLHLPQPPDNWPFYKNRLHVVSAEKGRGKNIVIPFTKWLHENAHWEDRNRKLIILVQELKRILILTIYDLGSSVCKSSL